MIDNQRFEDLTKIICPVSMLDDDTFQRLCDWPHGWEFWCGAWAETACRPRRPAWDVYRAKPAPMRKMSPPWDVIDARFNWAAMDSDGEVFFYTSKPKLSARQWLVADDGGNLECAGVLVFDRGTAPWDQSLVCRPGYEGDDA